MKKTASRGKTIYRGATIGNNGKTGKTEVLPRPSLSNRLLLLLVLPDKNIGGAPDLGILIFGKDKNLEKNLIFGTFPLQVLKRRFH